MLFSLVQNYLKKFYNTIFSLPAVKAFYEQLKTLFLLKITPL